MTAKQELLEVLSNRPTAPGHYVLEVASARIARGAHPGQFVQILVDKKNEPLLPRPFSFLDVSKTSFRILYQMVGKGTAILAGKKKGDRLSVLGPLGNGFAPAKKAARILIVGGGVGIPPLYHFVKEARSGGVPGGNMRVFLGARSKALLHCEKEFRALGVGLGLATDDGSRGRKGFVTELLDEALAALGGLTPAAPGSDPLVYTCGPTPMLKAVSALAAKYDVNCQVSVEEPMPCGFGACLGCAIKVKGGRYAMACCEGPVFDAKEIVWE